MADESTYIIRLASWLGSALGESAAIFGDFSTESLGVELPSAILSSGPVQSAARQAEMAAVKVREASNELGTIAASQDELRILAGFLEVGAALAEFSTALDGLLTAVRAGVTPATVPDAAARQAAESFADVLAKKVSDYAIASAITSRTPQLAFVLKLAGLLDWQYTPEGPTGVERPYVRKGLRLDRIKDLISDPGRHFRETLRWGENDFDPSDFFKVVRDFFPDEFEMELGVQAGDPFLKACMLIRRDRSQMPPGLLIAAEGSFSTNIEQRTSITDEWAVGISSNLRMAGSLAGRLRPPLRFELQPVPATGEISGELRAFFERAQSARPFDIVGGTGLLTISANNVNAGLGVRANWDIVQGKATIDPLLFASVEGLTLKIGAGDADSFIGALLAAAEIEGEFDLGLEWQASTGLRVTASGGIEIALPIHRQLGPIELQTIYFSLRIRNDGTLSTEVSAAIAGQLGPLGASVDRIGALLDVKFASGNEGDLGPLDLDLRFKPPNGIGLSVNAGVIVGGGYLYIDTERGEYAGAIELTFSGFISLKAIGLINTKMPDGSSGFSLLIIITAEFGSGLQLGYGFTLLAVGGILGLNRTMRLQALMEGVRTNAIESVMFPRDVVANAPRIISDLRNLFPPQNGLFLIGPMAKLGWGTPTLISVALGIIIEIPGNIAILGVLKVALPTDEAALIKLQVNFAGAIEFDKKRIYFFAALFDSRVVFLTIEGEMGLLVAFGDDGNFVVSVGGFHPSFSPPPLPFPSPRRVAISLIDTSVARIRVEGYFAVTSNTVQFGARVEMFFGFDALNISGHLAFDALFQFSPFHFIISISASFSLKVFGAGLFSVRISGSLSGPAPWRAAGSGSISILFFEISADFDITWGESDHTELPPIAVLPLLKTELEKRENWRALLPANNNLLVTLRKLPEEDSLVLHPVGTLRVAQRALPLELTLDKVGNKKPSDVKKVAVSVTSPALSKKSDTFEKFAPAQYQNFSDAEKLSRPAYVSERGGLEITAANNDDMASAKMVKRVVRYEEIIIDAQMPRVVLLFADFIGSLFDFFLGNGAIAKNELSHASRKKLDPFVTKVDVAEETYTVAFQANNQNYGSMTFHSEASAREFLASEVSRDPNLGEALHVIPSYERAA